MTQITRRSVLKTTAVAAAGVAMPAILRAKDALSSSGQVNVFAWGDYVQQNMIDKFQSDSGITINLSTYGSNDEAVQKLRASGGKGFDIIFPSVTDVPNYETADGYLLMELDESRVDVDSIIPSMVRDSIALGGVQGGKRLALPFDWGTEAVTFNSSVYPLADNEVSFGSLWGEGMEGKVAFRQKSIIVGTGLYLDATGAVPSNRMLDVYKSEDDAKRVWDAVTAFVIERKQNVGAFWNNATEATNAFTQAGCEIGQTWDTTGIKLGWDVDPMWKYRMPIEGGITWMDTIAMPSGAENIDQAYEFMNAMWDGQMAGLMVQNTGYNSASVDAAQYAGDQYAATFAEIYTPETLGNLWWWQADTPWIAPLSQLYVDQITNA